MKTLAALLLLAMGVALALAAGCNSGGGSSGSISVGLTDAPNLDPNLEQVWVTIDSIEVHRESAGDGEWVEVVPNAEVATPLTVDLLALRNGITLDLGLDSLPAGHYTQIRLHLGEVPEGGVGNPHPSANYVVIGAGGDDPGSHELTIPSGYQSGLKLIHPFDIQADTTYEIVLDIDTLHIHRTGSGRYMMKPTVRAIEVDLTGAISGFVAVEDGCPVSEQGVTVMAQVQDDPADPTSVRVVQAALTNPDGSFTLAFLPPGTYTLVAYKDDPGAGKVALGVATGVVVAAGQTAMPPVIGMACDDRLVVEGTVDDTGVPAGQCETITPVVTIFVDDDPDIVIALVGAPCSGGIYGFTAGLPQALDGSFWYVSDLGTANPE